MIKYSARYNRHYMEERIISLKDKMLNTKSRRLNLFSYLRHEHKEKHINMFFESKGLRVDNYQIMKHIIIYSV